jgi:dTDP-glucose pyrophosphorylase
LNYYLVTQNLGRFPISVINIHFFGHPKRGEFEVTDAINAYVASGQKIAVGTVTGDYMECGSVAGWLRANQIVCADLLQ